ncbi:hypothetical protein ALI144C_09475 [Actinosynnema sp. ALI-1.44]|uniref:NUDIX domain-containing protein n=1 Tax=Actinosynnema sp. ALI-1.44 TaxID=1933779 RepID=UPI00097C5D73|nr:NUDIX domain-containing protein [Actinosynnema sp. ALI-1.44]ONI87600.1 hypothetical protein ALI144C_09475 [Actinosynnema sp. ALI-1.44]
MSSSQRRSDLRNLVLNVCSNIVFAILILPVPWMRDQLRIYSTTGLVVFGIILLAVPAVHYLAARNSGKQHTSVADRLGVLGLTFVTFVGTTIIAESPVHNDAYLAVPLLVLAVSELWLFIGYRRLAAQNTSTPPGRTLGFAATSVLVHDRGTSGKFFVLVHNLNINSPHGLWVSPGGHFDPDVDDPTDVVIKKIASETGFIAELVATPGLETRGAATSLSTTETRWIEQPDFLLDEDLGGSCKMDHKRHLDFIYICSTKGSTAPAVVPKYTERDRIEVSLLDCAQDEGAAIRAIDEAVAEWHRINDGKARGRRESTSRDVAQRLYLTARHYTSTEAK